MSTNGTNGTNGHGINGNQAGIWSHAPMACRGVRGAVTVTHNTPDEILWATRELLGSIALVNDMLPNDVASVYFTTTKDLDAAYPAIAARDMGWHDVALLCGHEMDVPDGLPLCIRVLIHWNTPKSAQEVAHVYLREAVTLRPDLKERPLVRPIQMSPWNAAMKMMNA